MLSISICVIIYKTTNLINNKFYIGKSARGIDDAYLGSGMLLKKAIKKYGKSNFKKELLEEVTDEKLLDEREKYWIKFLDSTNKKIGYNITEGGTGGNTLKNHPNEKILFKKRFDALKEYQKTPEYKESRRLVAKKRWECEDHRKHMSDVMTGRYHTWGKKISESLKRKYAREGFPPVSEIRRKNTSAAHLGINDKELSTEEENKIVEMYKENGSKIISKNLAKEGVFISPFLIVRTLKKYGVYKKAFRGLKTANKKEHIFSIFYIKDNTTDQDLVVSNLSAFCKANHVTRGVIKAGNGRFRIIKTTKGVLYLTGVEYFKRKKDQYYKKYILSDFIADYSFREFC